MQPIINDEFIDFGSDYSGDQSQLLGAFYPKARRLDPIHDLMEAILKDAIAWCDLRWINSRNEDYVFSLVRICDELGLDPDAVRDALNRRLAGKEPKKKPNYLKKNNVVVGDSDAGFSHVYEGPRH